MKHIFIPIISILTLSISLMSNAQISRANTKKSNPYLANYQRVGSGSAAFHALEIRGGQLYSWGQNTYGQLGDGTTTNRSTPTLIPNQSDWSIAAGGLQHSIGIKADGTLYSWGDNTYGQIGDGTSTQRNSPTKIGTDNKWVSISAGSYHSVGLKSDGTLWAWGRNANGQLGTGNYTNQNTPQKIGSDNNWVNIIAGQYFTLALKADGTLWAWGDNSQKQLGDGTTTPKNTPTKIGTDNDWTHIAAGALHSLALKSNGKLYAWGYNYCGQLGNSNTTGTPLQVGTDNKWIGISAGAVHSMGLKSDGTLWTWGYNNDGELGNGTYGSQHWSHAPSQVGIDNNWVSIVAGTENSYAVKSNGILYGWGYNTTGQVGDNSTIQRNSPVLVNEGSNSSWLTISGGTDHTSAVRTDGTLYNWGGNAGVGPTLLDNSNTYANKPTQVGTGNQWTSVDSRGLNSFSLRSDGSNWFWGNTENSAYGPQPSQYSEGLALLQTNKNWEIVSSGEDNYVAIASDGGLYTWGNNTEGSLGVGSQYGGNPNGFNQIGDNLWTGASAGRYHDLAIKSDGSLWAWGSNFSGQIGNGNTTDQFSPVRIVAPNNYPDFNWVAVSAALGDFSYTLGRDFSNSIALKSDGTLWAWGDNTFGQLGIGNNTQQTIPVKIQGPTASPDNWISIATGANHALGLKADGTLWAWGDNSYGELGNNSTISANIPQPVNVAAGNTSLWVKISAGYYTSYGIKSDGTLWAWGKNVESALGSGSTIGNLGLGSNYTSSSYTTPQQITNYGAREESIESIIAKADNNGISIYPNPNNGSFNLKSDVEGKYVITNELGQPIQTIYLDANTDYKAQIENLQSGIYFIKGHNDSKTKKIAVYK